MAFLHRRDAVRAVLLRVVLGADAEEAAVEESHRAREHALPREPAPGEVLLRRPADTRQRARKPQHLVELLLVAPGPPLLVVEVLPPAGRIGSDRLDVPERVRTDPDVLPGRRDDELADALEDLLVLDPLAVLVQVLEAAASPAAEDSGPRAVAAAQSWHRGAFFPASAPAKTGGLA